MQAPAPTALTRALPLALSTWKQVEHLLHMTDVHQRIRVSPSYIEFATQESPFLRLVRGKEQQGASG